jgi:hypothetical protein
MTFANHYETLGLDSGSSSSQIKDAYRTLAKMHHPDRSSKPDAHERFIAIQTAYEVLSDPIRRKEFDFFQSGDFHGVSEAFATEHSWADGESIAKVAAETMMDYLSGRRVDPPPWNERYVYYTSQLQTEEQWGYFLFLAMNLDAGRKIDVKGCKEYLFAYACAWYRETEGASPPYQEIIAAIVGEHLAIEAKDVNTDVLRLHYMDASQRLAYVGAMYAEDYPKLAEYCNSWSKNLRLRAMPPAEWYVATHPAELALDKSGNIRKSTHFTNGRLNVAYHYGFEENPLDWAYIQGVGKLAEAARDDLKLFEARFRARFSAWTDAQGRLVDLYVAHYEADDPGPRMELFGIPSYPFYRPDLFRQPKELIMPLAQIIRAAENDCRAAIGLKPLGPRNKVTK